MRSLTEWIDEVGFYVSEAWDFDQAKMIGSEKLELTDTQRRILDHCFVADEDEKFPYVTVIE